MVSWYFFVVSRFLVMVSSQLWYSRGQKHRLCFYCQSYTLETLTKMIKWNQHPSNHYTHGCWGIYFFWTLLNSGDSWHHQALVKSLESGAGNWPRWPPFSTFFSEIFQGYPWTKKNTHRKIVAKLMLRWVSFWGMIVWPVECVCAAFSEIWGGGHFPLGSLWLVAWHFEFSLEKSSQLTNLIWKFPKIGVPPDHPF